MSRGQNSLRSDVKKIFLESSLEKVGSSISIKSIKKINCTKDLYKNKQQISNLLLFILAINTGLDLKDLLELKVKDVKDKEYICVSKNKTILLNDEIKGLISEEIKNKKSTNYLFYGISGQKKYRSPIFNSFKSILKESCLRDKYSVASLRKTFAYHYYLKCRDLSYLMWLFNQHMVNIALEFINVNENMNLRSREGVCL